MPKISAESREQAQTIFDSNFIDYSTGEIKDLDKEATSAWIPYLRNIIDILWPKNIYKPTKLQEVNQHFIKATMKVSYVEPSHKEFDDLVKAKVLACVFRKGRNNHSIFFNPHTEIESHPAMDLHEKGHIKFNHTTNVDAHIAQFKKLLEKIWDDKIDKHFSEKVVNDSKNKDKIVNLLFREFSNIAQDMEINSKFFGETEWETARQSYSRQILLVHLNTIEPLFDTLTRKPIDNNAKKEIIPALNLLINNIQERLDKKYDGEDLAFCYPTNKGWPEGLDWMVYMTLLVKDFDDAVQHIIKQLSKGLSQSQKSGDEGQGENQGNSSQGSGTVVSQEMLDKFCEDSEAEAEAIGKSGDQELEISDDSGSNTGRSSGDNNKGNTHNSTRLEFETCESMEDLRKFFLKNCYGKKQTRLNTDVLYYSNRRKLGSTSVVVPRRHFIDRWVNQKVCILIDVSGSVSTDLVEKVINTIVETNTGIDLKESRIIFWDTSLVLDEPMDSRTKKVYSGGGTTIGKGIEYCSKYMKKKTDTLFVISDLCDNLEEWIEAGEKIPGRKFIVGYGGNEKQIKKTDSKFFRQWNNIFTKTVFINDEA